MLEGYNSSEHFCAVPEIWTSYSIKLYIGIVYADSEISHVEDSIFQLHVKRLQSRV